VSFPFRIRRNSSRASRHPFGALLVIAALVAGFAGLAGVSPANATLTGGSPFDASNGQLDDNAGPAHPDLPEGTADDSYKGGAKENDLCPTVEDGSIQNKGELLNVYIAMGEGAGGTFLYLAFDRLETASQNGTVALDFELNQATELACNGVNPIRTVGDKLITYEFQGSLLADEVLISVWTWDGDKWVGGETPLNSEAAEGSINTERTFGEMAINLEEAGIFTAGQCDNFASVFTKGRSSSAEGQTSELKDFIAPIPQHVANCGALAVSKTVVGGKAGDKFDFTVDCPGEAKDATFSLAGGESKTVDDIPLGAACIVTETDPGTLWTMTRTINGASAGSGAATVIIDPDNESVEFTNTAKPVVAPVEVLGITVEQPAPLAVLPRTGTPARDIALMAFGLVGLGLGLRRLTRRPKHSA
jgi:hypothetical protein